MWQYDKWQVVQYLRGSNYSLVTLSQSSKKWQKLENVMDRVHTGGGQVWLIHSVRCDTLDYYVWYSGLLCVDKLDYWGLKQNNYFVWYIKLLCLKRWTIMCDTLNYYVRYIELIACDTMKGLLTCYVWYSKLLYMIHWTIMCDTFIFSCLINWTNRCEQITEWDTGLYYV